MGSWDSPSVEIETKLTLVIGILRLNNWEFKCISVRAAVRSPWTLVAPTSE